MEKGRYEIICHEKRLAAHLTTHNLCTPFVVTGHWHDDIEILYITEGRGIVIVNSSETIVECHDVVAFNSNEVHSMKTFECDKVSYHCLLIQKEFLEFNDIYSINLPTKTGKKHIRECIERIASELEAEDTMHKTLINACILQLLVSLCREVDANDVNLYRDDRKINNFKNVIEYINNNYSRKITVDELSEKFSYNKYYLCHVFKEITGLTIISYINYYRCLNARRMLLDKQPVSEVAAMCGFCNISYFAKMYKKHMGYLPSRSLQFLPGRPV